MAKAERLLRRTRSVCPVCLAPLEAELVDRGDAVYLCKTCPEHGSFAVPVWRNRLDFLAWRAGAQPLGDSGGLGCPANCGLCAEHEQATCCALLEVTSRCNLRCPFCFARGGETAQEPDLDTLKHAVDRIMADCGRPLLQLSGGEPTLRDDLPVLVRYAKEAGAPYVQINTNGIRLADDRDYVRQLAEAGLSIVFLQFDGVDDAVYTELRGRPLLETKTRAIANCADFHIGVTLVPTLVRGINTAQLGSIVRFGASRSPAVRGVHFQPVSYFGRYPAAPDDGERYTLDELIAGLCAQLALPEAAFLPSRCDHPICGFHASFLANPDGGLVPFGAQRPDPCARTTAAQNREYIARRWSRQDVPADLPAKPAYIECGRSDEIPDMAAFLRRVRTGGFTLTAMAFQDAMNLDIERLRRCSLHVYSGGKIKPFCAHYLTAVAL